MDKNPINKDKFAKKVKNIIKNYLAKSLSIKKYGQRRDIKKIKFSFKKLRNWA